MHLTLVAAGLLAHDAQALSVQPALARFAALAEASAEPDLDTALLHAVGVDTAIAPLAAAGAGVDVGDRWVIRADPVSMAASHDDVRMHAIVDDLDLEDARRVVARLSRHFAQDDLVFVAPRTDAWFALSDARHTITTTPLAAAIGRPLRDLLPQGPDAGRWRRWITEIQMLLHDDALAERTAKPLTGVWFSGGGELPERSRLPALNVAADAGRTGDVARGLSKLAGREARTTSPPLDVTTMARMAEHHVIALRVTDEASSLARFAHDFLEPAVVALGRGSLASLDLCADSAEGAAWWKARSPSLAARVLRRKGVFARPPGKVR